MTTTPNPRQPSPDDSTSWQPEAEDQQALVEDNRWEMLLANTNTAASSLFLSAANLEVLAALHESLGATKTAAFFLADAARLRTNAQLLEEKIGLYEWMKGPQTPVTTPTE